MVRIESFTLKDKDLGEIPVMGIIAEEPKRKITLEVKGPKDAVEEILNYLDESEVEWATTGENCFEIRILNGSNGFITIDSYSDDEIFIRFFKNGSLSHEIEKQIPPAIREEIFKLARELERRCREKTVEYFKKFQIEIK